MRRALIADIHGNLVALEAVLKDCRAQGVDEILCLGDMCGMGPDIVECIDLVRAECAWSLAGDHEIAKGMRLPESSINAYNRATQQLIRRELSLLKPSWHSFPAKRVRWKWIEALEPMRKYAGALFVHASPRDPVMEYVLPHIFDSDSNVDGRAVMDSFQGLCFGAHSHMAGFVREDCKWECITHDVSVSYELNERAKLYVNVGSVGQPRDRDPRSSYVIWDNDTRSVKFLRVAYDLSAARKRFFAVPGFEFYAGRLEKGH
jgi:diadenosine tetraphosphatase ApaH/serine/threonine PP2A family protein phosphatase